MYVGLYQQVWCFARRYVSGWDPERFGNYRWSGHQAAPTDCCIVDWYLTLVWTSDLIQYLHIADRSEKGGSWKVWFLLYCCRRLWCCLCLCSMYAGMWLEPAIFRYYWCSWRDNPNILMIIGRMMPALGIGLTLMYIFKGEQNLFFIGFLFLYIRDWYDCDWIYIALYCNRLYTEKSTGGNAAWVKQIRKSAYQQRG